MSAAATCHLALPAEIAHHNAGDLARSLVAAWKAQPHAPACELDAAALQSFDSSALALLLQLQREAKAQGRSLSLRNAPARLNELAQLYGVQKLL